MPIYVGTQKINVSGVKKVYVGTQLVYQDAPVLTSITLSGQTTSLNRGASFSFGGTVTAHYSNGSTANVTSSTTFSGYNMSTSGTYTVTASYTEGGITKTATYSLTVTKAWTALWSGSKSMSWTKTGGMPSNVLIVEPNTTLLPNNSTIRITFTMSNKSGTYGHYFTAGNTKTDTKPTSPYQVSNFDRTKTTYVIVGVSSSTSSTNNGHKIYVRWYKPSGSNGYFQIGATEDGSAYGTVSLTVTKIERYY